ncbi:ABC transporter ATP-binding protein [Paenibacillus gansuensis]|uniref:ABC transporter ATP-binding protein n=1 Tax=Paenibacillus gansuensis TaxID=306542 RepID=A0ABW5PAY2_9BACL
MQAANLVEIRDLSIQFPMKRGVVQAVQNVSLDIPRGKITALVGESGSGKSTLASALLRMVSSPGVIAGGSIKFDGTELLKLKKRELREYRWSQTAMVFQAAQNALNPVVRIGEQFIETYVAHKKERKEKILDKVKHLLDYVRLDPNRVLNAYPHELSGGMKQRVMIAFSLLLDPKLIILDEPTTALDVITQEYIFNILMQIHKDLGITMLLLSHDIAIVAKAADQVGVMYAGNLVEVGETCDMFAAPKHPYTSGLIKAAPSLLTEAAEPIAGSPPNMLNTPAGCKFHPRCKHAMEMCGREQPPLLSLDNQTLVACHLHSAGHGTEGGAYDIAAKVRAY